MSAFQRRAEKANKKKLPTVLQAKDDPGLKEFTSNQMNMCTVRYYESYLEDLFMAVSPAKQLID